MERGIADKRTEYRTFRPMEGNPGGYGLKPVRPYFGTANRTRILEAIELACRGAKEGSSVYDPKTGSGYYVNCNPRNRQLLNGYIPSDPRRMPRSRHE